jgi:hypothetical protein
VQLRSCWVKGWRGLDACVVFFVLCFYGFIRGGWVVAMAFLFVDWLGVKILTSKLTPL